MLHVGEEWGSIWWSNLINISWGVGARVGSLIDDNSVCEADDGTSILFWWDPWLRGGVLKDRFNRLILAF